MRSPASSPVDGRSGTRTAIYARVSGEVQRTEETIKNQLSTLPRFAERLGLQVVRTYVDDGISGATGTEQRDGLRGLLEGAERREFDFVTVYDISRLTRAEDWIARSLVVGTLQRARIKIADASTGVVHDLNTEQGDLLVGLGTFFAARERREIRRRTMEGRRRAALEGRKPHGPDPYGLAYDREAKVFGVREDEAAVVREIFAMMLAGRSCGEIARSLNESGAPTRARRNQAPSWSRTRVNQIVRSTTYRGQLVVNRRDGVTIDVPAIVGDATWHEAQECLQRKRRSMNAERSRHVALAMGRARCAACGASMGIAASKKRGKLRRYYACMRRLRPTTTERCSARFRRVEEVDARLWARIEGLLAGEWEALAARLDAAAQVDDTQAQIERVEARLAHLEKAESAVLARFRRQLISERAMDAELRTIGSERAGAHAELARLRDARVHERWTAQDLGAAIGSIRARLANCMPDQRQAIAWALIPGHGRYLVTIGDDSVDAVACLDPRAWLCSDAAPDPGAGSVSGSSSMRWHGSYSLKPIEIRLVA